MTKGMHSNWTDQHGKLLKERFTAVSASDLLARPSRIIDTVGVYAILIRDAEMIFGRLGYNPKLDGALWNVGGYGHVYTGESVGVCSRLLEHLIGSSRESTFRESLIALQRATGAIWNASHSRYYSHTDEQNLSDWLAENALVAFKHCILVGEVERDLLRRAPCPLNIKDRPRTPFTGLLSDARRTHGIPRKTGEPLNMPRASRQKPYLLHAW
jgi:hypothetical protein